MTRRNSIQILAAFITTFHLGIGTGTGTGTGALVREYRKEEPETYQRVRVTHIQDIETGEVDTIFSPPVWRSK